MSAENWSACFAETERWEGWHKFTNDPRDPGGATYCGLTQNTFNGWCKKTNTPIRPVQKATDDEIQQIFKTQYWHTVCGDDLWVGLDLLMFDRAINEDPVRPIKDLQRIVRTTVDGQFGLETLNAVQQAYNHSDILRALHLARLGFWRSLRHLWGTFGTGWTNRETDIYTVAQRMMYKNV